MDNQGTVTKTVALPYQMSDYEQDEQIICYYDALLQSIRDGVEDLDLMDKEDIEAAFSEDQEEKTKAEELT